MPDMNDTQLIHLNQLYAESEQQMDAEEVLAKVYDALKEKGYNPVTQIVGYIMSGDPTYITNHKSARALIMKVERDELLTELVEYYLNNKL